MKNNMMIDNLRVDLRNVSSKERAISSMSFFKCGYGEYGEGDEFLGVTVPEQRKIARKYKDLPLDDLKSLILSRYHEERLCGLFILVGLYRKADCIGRRNLVDFYVSNRSGVNNWDLVDSSAHYILGDYLIDKGDDEKKILYDFAKSGSLWERRIAMLSCYAFIRVGEFDDALLIAEELVNDSHDLIHKIVGWMLREIGNRNLKVEEGFLRRHYKTMPRTMLRYAIEKFDKGKKDFYMGK